jgi:hypothetical protein
MRFSLYISENVDSQLLRNSFITDFIELLNCLLYEVLKGG